IGCRRPRRCAESNGDDRVDAAVVRHEPFTHIDAGHHADTGSHETEVRGDLAEMNVGVRAPIIHGYGGVERPGPHAEPAAERRGGDREQWFVEVPHQHRDPCGAVRPLGDSEIHGPYGARSTGYGPRRGMRQRLSLVVWVVM